MTTVSHVLHQVPGKRIPRDRGELGFVADLLDIEPVCPVQPTDTVVPIAGPQSDAALADVAELVCDTQAVLLAAATHQTPMLLHRAGRCRHHSPVDGSCRVHRGTVRDDSFDPMSFLAIHGVREM